MEEPMRTFGAADESPFRGRLQQQQAPTCAFPRGPSGDGCTGGPACADDGLGDDSPSRLTVVEMRAELSSLRREVQELRRLQDLADTPIHEFHFSSESPATQQLYARNGHLQKRAGNAEEHSASASDAPPHRSSRSAASDDTLQNISHRGAWLVGLLIFQSSSALILERFHPLLHQHPVVIYFLTMLVGAGGNVGGQSTMLVVRRLALEKISCLKAARSSIEIVSEQARVGIQLAMLLAFACLWRCLIFKVVGYEALAICISIFCIVFASSLIGSALPLFLKHCGMDPAHAGAAIQVVMDITGVLMTCIIASIILGVPLTSSVMSSGPVVQARPPIQLGEMRAIPLGNDLGGNTMPGLMNWGVLTGHGNVYEREP